MSESVGTVIKILAALTSVKACIKYLCVAVVLAAAWVFVEPKLVSISSIPDDQKSFILILVGISVGSLIGELVSNVYEKIVALVKEKKDANLQIEKDKAEAKSKILADENFLIKFKATFVHFTYSQKELLRKLTKENQKVYLANSDNTALQKNNYIIAVSKVTGSDYLVALNPLLRDFVLQNWTNELNQQVDDFLNSALYDSKSLIEAMTVGNEEHMIDPAIFSPLFDHSSSVIRCNINDEDEEEGVWVWFTDNICDVLREKLEIELIEERFIPSTKFIEGVEA
ncbi:TPA: hypothetical protein ACGF3M_003524 [Vibrio cholerae]